MSQISSADDGIEKVLGMIMACIPSITEDYLDECSQKEIDDLAGVCMPFFAG